MDAPLLSVSHPLDVFVLESGHRAPTEWVVGFDDLGRLGAQPFAEAVASPSVRAQLSYHEVAGGSRRALRAEELHLFAIELCEQAANSPGFDDPVHLYGSLLGPLGTGALVLLEGQLTVTRADLLEAAARGAGNAFRYGGGGGVVARAFHLLLPGDRPEELGAGRGVVLAYPVLSADLHTATPGNEFFFNQILYDVITGLWSDVATEAPPPRRRTQDVPVPNRALVEQRLVNEGFVIVGERAVRRRKGLLGSVLDALAEEGHPLPREGRSDDYVALAQEALSAVAGWPAPRARALRACLGPAPVSPPVPSFGSGFVPEASPLPPPVPPPVRRPGPPAWMEDFINAHAKPGAPPPIVTTATPPAWMSDFVVPGVRDSEADKREPDAKTVAPARPAWMKDFDS